MMELTDRSALPSFRTVTTRSTDVPACVLPKSSLLKMGSGSEPPQAFRAKSSCGDVPDPSFNRLLGVLPIGC